MATLRWFLAFSLFVVLLGCTGHSQVSNFDSRAAGTVEETRPPRSDYGSRKLAPFEPTSMEVVEKMLALAKVNSSDVVYDLGSGDGRIVIMAGQKYGARAFGFEIDPKLVRESRENVQRAGVEHLVEIRQQDIMTADLSGATVVTMFLLPAANLMLRPKLLRELKTGARVVSNEHNMGDWKPEGIVDGDFFRIYLWRIVRPIPHLE